MIESLQNMDILIPRLLPVACLFLFYLGIRIKFADKVANVSGQAKESGVFIRSILSLLLIAASIALWLMGPQAVDLVKQQFDHTPKEYAQITTLPFDSPAPVARAPINIKRSFYPTILSASKQAVVIDAKGSVISIRQGMRTPGGWLLTSSSPDEAIFLDDQNLKVVIRYSETSGKWMIAQ